MLRDSVYHSFLRITALTLALVLLFDSGLLLPVTKQLSQNAQQYVAQSVGVNATVSPNELNQLTAELTAQKNALNEREANIREREIAVGLNTEGGVGTNASTYILSAILFLLLVLILLNYLQDYVRSRRNMSPSIPSRA